MTERRRGRETRRTDSIADAARETDTTRALSGTILRYMAILECFERGRQPQGISGVSGLLRMNRNTTKRYVAMLFGLGYLDRMPRQKYRLGIGATGLGLSTISELALDKLAEPVLSELSRETRRPASLVMLDADEIVVVSVISGDRKTASGDVPATRRKGRRLQAYCTAGGKILLGGLPAYEREALLDDMEFRQLTPKTITSKEDLRKALDRAKSKSLASEEGECDDNVWALAAPVWNHLQEVVAAVVLQEPDGMGAREAPADDVVSSLRTAGCAVSGWLGYRDGVGGSRG